ncbi:hypothetical protein P3T27_007688 [Kitasatospora sp. MAA19]|uniref:hypothetical protein n=1 Tax=unclassified Kitasatospora TaxID=2633591 RepID=UPI002473C6EF|nr:hypothetical protein [Kitasatospora sp. MAA19]MDH6710937.1 hypothetical protein [Kitasatospora sp. MAA19]
MPTVTAALLRQLLDSSAENPVLYVSADSDTPELDVWAGALVDNGTVVITRTELTDWLGDDWTDADLREYLPALQETADSITGAH